MSESVSNVEIEDVLSSIRRLVSEENRPTARRDSGDVPRKPSRLVLTPSLLVPVPDTDEVSEDHAGDTAADDLDDQSLTPESEADLSALAPVTEDFAAEVTEDAGTVDPVQSDSGYELLDDFVFVQAPAIDSDALLDLSDFEAGAESAADSDIETDIETETEVTIEADTETETEAEPEIDTVADTDAEQASDTGPAPWRDPETTLYEAAETMPDLAFLPAEKDEDPEIESTAPDETATDSATQHDLDADEEAAEFAEPEPLADAQAAPDAEVEPTDADPFNTATLSAKIAVLEAKIGETQDQWEPDGETDDDYAGTSVETIQWQDHTDEERTDEASTVEPDADPDLEPELTVIPDPAPEPEPAVQVEETLDFLPEDETILDEESLRELVADIVRQELQGALGERITRNVRKLVRREIHRALTAQELD